jgi:hypothetical protein
LLGEFALFPMVDIFGLATRASRGDNYSNLFFVFVFVFVAVARATNSSTVTHLEQQGGNELGLRLTMASQSKAVYCACHRRSSRAGLFFGGGDLKRTISTAVAIALLVLHLEPAVRSRAQPPVL